MAQLKPAPKRASISIVPGSTVSGVSAFGNSKFFVKKQNRAATRIQSLFRVFLVQARLYRKRVLEPRLQELKDCEDRKTEELRRIREQKEEEFSALPAAIRLEMEASAVEADTLRQEIKEYTTANETLKQDRKEAKRKNKELEQEKQELKEKDFKVAVSNNKINKEMEELRPLLERYTWALDDGNRQKDELEGALMKVIHQQTILKRFIGKIIKLVEDKAHSGSSSSPPSSPKQRRKSRTNISVSISPPSSPKQRRKSGSQQSRRKSHANISATINISPPSSPKQKRKSGGKRSSKKRPSISKGHASFNWATKSFSSLDVDLTEELSQHLEEQPDDKACFDWATKSYNWSNDSIEIGGDLDDLEDDSAPAAATARRQLRKSKSSERQKRPPRNNNTHSNKPKNSDSAMKELLHEVKTLKKKGLKR